MSHHPTISDVEAPHWTLAETSGQSGGDCLLPAVSSLRFSSQLLLAILALLLAGEARAGTAGKPVHFRKPQVEMAALETVVGTQITGEADPVAESLEERKQTLEGEIRFATSKLEALKKKLDAQRLTGTAEDANRLDREASEWQARILAVRAQLAGLEGEQATATAAADAIPEPAGDSQIIVPGETLEVFVVEDTSFNGRYQVRRGGYVILPQVGRIPVAGRTLDGAELAVKRALQASQLQRASVMIERLAGTDAASGPLIYLTGEFRNPRPYNIPAGTAPTLVGVILSSGGVSEKGDLTRVKVMRMAANKGLVEEVNVQKILDGGGLSSDLTLAEGDVVIIPPGQSNLIYVTGNVKKQGSYQLVSGERLSAYGAILQSGGFAKFADQRKVHVLRALPDGTKAKLPVNVVAIQRGQQPDVVLQSNDIVVVPEKFFSF